MLAKLNILKEQRKRFILISTNMNKNLFVNYMESSIYSESSSMQHSIDWKAELTKKFWEVIYFFSTFSLKISTAIFLKFFVQIIAYGIQVFINM